MPVKGTRMARLWEREVGRLPPKRFADAVKASQDFVHSLGIQKRLQNHVRCVNTISFNTDGRLLLSGSNDEYVVLWNWEESVPTLVFYSGHENHVLHAQFMPFSGDRSIVTSGADGEVRHAQIQEGGHVVTDVLFDLKYVVHKFAVEPGSSHTFFTCGMDGTVWLFDLREKYPRKLFKCGQVSGDIDRFTGQSMELYSIAIDPTNPCCFAVAGSDEHVRLFDTRKISLYRRFGEPIEQFCPPHLIDERKDGITGLAFSQTGELLASYRFDNVYLFTREHGMRFNNIQTMDETVRDRSRVLHYYIEKLPVPQTFKGHRSMRRVKGVNFLGPNCDYVTSGSDCGHIFIWSKKNGDLVRMMKGDTRIVKCVEQHPSEIVVASSGIDCDIKIWAPGGSENPSMAHFDEVGPHRHSSSYDGFVYMNDETSSSGSDLADADGDDFNDEEEEGEDEDDSNDEEEEDEDEYDEEEDEDEYDEDEQEESDGDEDVEEDADGDEGEK